MRVILWGLKQSTPSFYKSAFVLEVDILGMDNFKSSLSLSLLMAFLLLLPSSVFANNGVSVIFWGWTVPGREIHVKIIDFPEETTLSKENGYFKKQFNNIAPGVYRVIFWVKDIKGNVGKETELHVSVPEDILTFTAGDLDLVFKECYPNSDLNQDDKVNLYDFSIFLFWWGSNYSNADLNCDGKVNLYDFSILLSDWTNHIFR